MEKKCSKCGNELPISDFYQRSKSKSYHSACKSCERKMAKDWYSRNEDYAKSKVKEWRENHLDDVRKYRVDNRQKLYRQEIVRKYGVEKEWFDRTMEDQGKKCASCGREFEFGEKQKSPHVDHSHQTGTVRGILCNRCNTVLGLCEDSEKLLEQLAGYLRLWHGYSQGS